MESDHPENLQNDTDSVFVWDENSQLYFHARFTLNFKQQFPALIFSLLHFLFIHNHFENIRMFKFRRTRMKCCLGCFSFSCGSGLHSRTIIWCLILLSRQN